MFMFTHHVYCFGGENYLQSDSGPIGLRITMAVARLVMSEWGERMRDILTDAGIKVFLEGSFVDDIRYVTSPIPNGVRWSQQEKKFVFKEEWFQEESEFSPARRKKKTSEELCFAMNSIFPNIKFTVEVEDDFESKRLPTLDAELFFEGNFLRFSFYEKPMKNPYCIMKSSAMSEKSKIQILSQDLIRRMQNTCQTIPQSERNKIVDSYTDRLVRSGYSQSQVREIIVSGLMGYENKVTRAKRDNIPLHRPAAATLKNRLHKKLTQKQNWYKGKKKSNSQSKQTTKKSKTEPKSAPPIVSVMFVQYTPHSQLLQQMRQMESKITAVTGDRVKLVERSGTKLRHLLVSSDPWRNRKCGDKMCLICSNPLNTSFTCRKRNVSYKTYCLKCADDAGMDSKTINKNISENIKFYFGETFRDAYTRGKEHLSDYRAETEDSRMLKHLSEDHPGCDPSDIKFGMSVVKSHKSSFERQIFESILIFRAGKNILNSKSEFSRCKVPRLSVMVGEESQHEADFKITYEKKKLNKRLFDDEANFGCKPPKKKKCYGSYSLKVVKIDTEDQKSTEAKNLIEETSPIDPAPDEENIDVKVFPTFNNSKSRKPKPTKKTTKTFKDLTGQQKISKFFSYTKADHKVLSTQKDPT